MSFAFLKRAGDAHALAVGMIGAKMGERIAQFGCADGGRLGAVAKRVGLSGRFVAYMPDEASAGRAREGAAGAGVLADVETAAFPRVAGESDAFDLVIVDDTGSFLSAMTPETGDATIREALRLLRPGGRLMVIAGARGRGLSRLLSAGRSHPSIDHEKVLDAAGCKLVRRLAERDGLVFVEGIKPRDAA